MASKRDSIYFVILWTSFSLFPSFTHNFRIIFNGGTPELGIGALNLTIAMLGYYIIGGLFSQIKIDTNRISRRLNTLIFTLSTTTTILLTFLISRKLDSPSEAFFVYYSPLIAASSISLFLIFKEININDKTARIISIVSNASLGIYFIHPIVIDYFKLMILTHSNALSIIGMGILVFTISFLITLAISKIPIIKKTI